MSLQVGRFSVCFGVRTRFGVRTSTAVAECMIVFRVLPSGARSERRYSGYGGNRVDADVLPQRYPFVTASPSL